MSAMKQHPEFASTRELRWLGQGIQSADETRQAQALRDMIETLGTEQAYKLAQRNDVACIVGHAADCGTLASELAAPFALAHAQTLQRIARYMTRLDHIAETLAGLGIPLVALKNAGIARGIQGCYGCCPMGDVDVLVRRSDFREAHRVLMELGYQFEFRSPLEMADTDEAERSGGTEYWMPDEGEERFWLELQWRPVAGRWIRPDQEPKGDALIDRSVSIEGSHVRLLAPEDNLLQVALHTAKHTYVRAPGFRLHTDVDRIVTKQSIQWDTFVSRVAELQVRTPAYFSLLLSARLLGSAIPENVLAELKVGDARCRWIARQLNRVGLLDPDAPKFRRWQYLAFNAALYDDLSGLWRAVFPGVEWMQQRYGTRSAWLLPWGYARRACDLLVRRVRT
jgi:hypothetical protein